eukprot:6492778-Amphidinium_carterae.1
MAKNVTWDTQMSDLQMQALRLYTDVSLAPTGGKSHEGTCLFHGPNLIGWRTGKQALTRLSSCESELVAMVRNHRSMAIKLRCCRIETAEKCW